ncbi:MAG TPA: hypothetical protein VID30_08795, partial [Bradyrhizobium sp.]
MPHHFDKLVGGTIAEAVLGEFGLDEVPEGRNLLATMIALIGGIVPATVTVAGIALAATVAAGTLRALTAIAAWVGTSALDGASTLGGAS